MKAGLSLATLAILVAIAPPARPSARMGGAAAATAGAPATGAHASAPTEPGTEPLLESVPDGYIDWGRGFVGAWGKALVRGQSPSLGPGSEFERAGEIGGRARLLAIMQRVRANAEVRVGDRPDFVEKVRGIVRGAVIVNQRMGRGSFYEVLVEAPLNGVDGIAYGIYELMAQKASSPPAGSASASSGPGAGGTPAGQQTASAPDAPTGIVIDARGTGLAPALLPRIVDESGAVISAPDTVDPDALRDRGMAAYAKDSGLTSALRDRVGDHPVWLRASAAVSSDEIEVDPAFFMPAQPVPVVPRPPAPPPAPDPLKERRGPRPYHLKSSASAGSLKADVVLSKADADRLEAAPGGKNLLKDCRVVVIVESPVGGIEGMRHPADPGIFHRGAQSSALRPWPRRD